MSSQVSNSSEWEKAENYGQHAVTEKRCIVCRGSGQDRDGADCINCEGYGTVLVV